MVKCKEPWSWRRTMWRTSIWLFAKQSISFARCKCQWCLCLLGPTRHEYLGTGKLHSRQHSLLATQFSRSKQVPFRWPSWINLLFLSAELAVSPAFLARIRGRYWCFINRGTRMALLARMHAKFSLAAAEHSVRFPRFSAAHCACSCNQSLSRNCAPFPSFFQPGYHAFKLGEASWAVLENLLCTFVVELHTIERKLNIAPLSMFYIRTLRKFNRTKS
jgi:hypothetical protein